MKRIISIIKAQLKNKENKGLIQNIFSLSVLQIASYIVPLITLPYLIRVLGSDKFGLVSFAMAYVLYFISFVDYSFPLKATKEIAVSDKSNKVLSEIFSKVIYTKLVLFFIGLFITIILVNKIPIFKENAKIIYYTYLIVLSMIFYPFWFFQGLEKMKFITINNLLSRTFSVVLIILIVKQENDYVYVPLITSLSFIIGGFYAFYIIYRKFNIRLVKLRLVVVYRELIEGWPIFIINYLPNLYNNSSAFILGFIGTNHDVAYFVAGKRIVDAAQSFNSVLTRSFFPFLNRKSEKFGKAKYVLMGGGLMLSIALIIMAYPIYLIILTKEFLPSLYVILILSLSPFFISLDSTFGANGLLRLGYDKVYMQIIVVIAIIGLICAFIMIYFFSYKGAALNLVTIRALIGFTVLFYFKKKNVAQ